MIIKIGTIIKKLRQEKNITQETLAAALGVTPQAISRWESEGGYPDIELLPTLADFFSVSTDELLGYKLSERDEEIAKIKKEIDYLSETGTIEERVAHARKSFARYPYNCEIKENLAVCLYHLWHDSKNSDLISEIESLCNAVISECSDKDIRYDAINILINIYNDTKQCGKATEALNMLTPLKYCREFAKSSGIGDENTETYIQDEIDKLTDALGTAIANYPLSEQLPNDPSTWDRKVDMLSISNQLYKLIYGNNLMFYHTRLSRNYWLISTYQMAQGKTEEAIISLEKMRYHSIEYDRSYISDHGKHYTSILCDKLIYPEQDRDFHELKEHSNCYYMLDRLRHKRYDCIRENECFISIVNALREYEK